MWRIFEQKKTVKILEEKKSNNKHFLLLIEQIIDNIKVKIKNEIPTIIYILIQKSILHQYERKFMEVSLQ